jgi:4,5-DOPA dioxygenase extradiol
MNMVNFPALFVSHGAPNLLLGTTKARNFLAGLSNVLPSKPRAIVVISAHWETATPTVSSPAINETIHDFGGFEPELYKAYYPVEGSQETARRIVALGKAAGLDIQIDEKRGLDHGAWVPLMLAWPQADIPVIQLSVQTRADVDHHFALGAILEPLRNDGLLIIGSGSFTHDLRSYLPHRHDPEAAEPEWVTRFADWMDDAIVAGDRDSLRDYRVRAPEAVRNHPTEEHLLPLFVAMGAGGINGKARRLHRSSTHSVLRMDAYAFG